MKTTLIRTTLALGAAMMLSAADAGPKKKDHRVTVIVHRVTQISNMDSDPPFVKDDADFYALVWIDGQAFRTKNFSKDDGRPYWTLTATSSKSLVPIRIRLMDDDGGLENKDDPVDVNPMPDEKDILVYFNPATGQITGDAFGRKYRMLNFEGNGDGKKGKIAFTIE
jgi:hypothetical protein